MAKKRRTRKDKIRTDLRAKDNLSTVQTVSLSNSEHEVIQSYQPKTMNQETIQTSRTPVPTNAYNFLFKDLTKTAIVTGSIIAAQLLLVFILKY